MAYVELHGGAVACVRGSSNDLVSAPSAKSLRCTVKSMPEDTLAC